MLEFLAALAGTGIVAANFRAGADGPRPLDRRGRFADQVAALRGAVARTRLRRWRAVATAKGAGSLVHRALRRVAQEILESHQAGSAAENVVADLGFDVDHQLLENLERLGLEL